MWVQKISKKAGFVVAVALAAVVGGITTALVSAAIPDSGNTIHGCYSKNNGDLRVIDTEVGKTCSGQEKNLSWNAGNGGLLPINPGDTINGADLIYRDFSNTNLSGTNINSANLTGSHFNGANFTGSMLNGISGNQVVFDDTNLSPAAQIGNFVFTNSSFKRANFSGLSLEGSSFSVVDFTGVLFNNAMLQTVDLGQDNLTNSNFTNATLSNVSLLGSTMAGANVTSTHWDNVTCPDGTVSSNNGNTCVGHLNP